VALSDHDRLLAVVRYRVPSDLDAVLGALRDGGIRLLEVTADTPGALEAVRRAHDERTPIGAGTIRTLERGQAFAAVGAAFLVSPGLVPDLLREREELGIPVIPGAFTPTEIGEAIAAGAGEVKLFPASLGGPVYLSALRGPFPDVRLVPTGGIRIQDIPAWLEAGASCVGLGGSLVGTAPPSTGAELDRIADDARAAVALAAGRT